MASQHIYLLHIAENKNNSQRRSAAKNSLLLSIDIESPIDFALLGGNGNTVH
jgi:hypothetical protein